MGQQLEDLPLNGVRILLGGPIKAYFESSGFNSVARTRYEKLIALLRSAGATVYSAPEAEKFDYAVETPATVTQRDFDWCRSADVYLALWPPGPDSRPIPSQGTAIEIGWATLLRCPIVFLWDEVHADEYSHLVRGLSSIVATSYLDISSSFADIVRSILEYSTPR